MISFLSLSFTVQAVISETGDQGSHLLVQEVTSGGKLELILEPETVQFKPVKTQVYDQYRFQTTKTPNVKNRLTVVDTRSRGGFQVILDIEPIEATHKTIVQYDDSDPNKPLSERQEKVQVPLKQKKFIGNDNLHLMTTATSEFNGGESQNGVIYSLESQGPKTILAPYDGGSSSTEKFGAYKNSGTNLSRTPIVIMDGTLPANQGRYGEYSLDVNYAVKINKLQSPGEYQTNFTYTVIDSTE